MEDREKECQTEIPLQQDFIDMFPQESHNSVSRVHTPQEKPRSFLHYLREMFEVILGLGVTVLATMFVPGNWVPSELIFCVFFLLVFALAIRYRPFTAYSGSLLAGVSYTVLFWQRPELYAPSGILSVLIRAFLLLICGVLTNDLLRSQHRLFIMAEQKRVGLEAELQETRHKYQTALTINTELEQQIAGQTTTVITISDRMAQLWKLKGHKRYTALLDTIMHTLGAQSCVLYLHLKGKMILYTCQPAGAHNYSPILNQDDLLISGVIRQRRVCTIRDVLTQEQVVSQQVAVMAGPLFDDRGHITGIVIIDSIPMLKFTPGAVRLFSSILQMASLIPQVTVFEEENDQDMRRSLVSFVPTQHTIPVIKTH
ncbi:MAG: GAF domain-containing protein [Ktedonobacteraceae bacterium]|nr:GAF domain-containing protein [Ktedonobacteraceae bacterium]